MKTAQLTAPTEADLHSLPDRRLQQVLGLILRVGTSAAGVLIALGLAITAAAGRWPSGTVPGATSSVSHLLTHPLAVHPESITALGIVLLVATPAVQLMAAAVLFWRARDRFYAGVTMLVIAIVAGGAFLARGGA